MKNDNISNYDIMIFTIVIMIIIYSLIYSLSGFVSAVRPGVSSILSVDNHSVLNSSVISFNFVSGDSFCNALNKNLSLLRPKNMESWGSQAGYFRGIDDVRVMFGCNKTKFFAGPSLGIGNIQEKVMFSWGGRYFDIPMFNRSLERIDNFTVRVWDDRSNLSGRFLGFCDPVFNISSVSCVYNDSEFAHGNDSYYAVIL